MATYTLGHRQSWCLRRLSGSFLPVIALLCLSAISSGVSASVAGRWLGSVEIPGNEVSVTVDLEQDGAGAWIGSITMPQFNLSAVPLTDIVVSDVQASFSILNALGDPTAGKATFHARVETDTITGDFKQAGNSTSFVMHRGGSAQVVLPPRSTSVAKELVGTWVGDFIGIGDYARHVTVTLSNRGADGAVAKFVVIGKQTTDVPVDLVIYTESLLRIESSATEINFEGRYSPKLAEISGVFSLATFEFPLVLKRRKEGSTP